MDESHLCSCADPSHNAWQWVSRPVSPLIVCLGVCRGFSRCLVDSLWLLWLQWLPVALSGSHWSPLVPSGFPHHHPGDPALPAYFLAQTHTNNSLFMSCPWYPSCGRSIICRIPPSFVCAPRFVSPDLVASTGIRSNRPLRPRRCCSLHDRSNKR